MSAKKEKGVGNVEKLRFISVDVDTTWEEIVGFNSEEGVILSWDPYSFKELDADKVNVLKGQNLENYFKALFKNKERAAVAKKEIISDILSPLEGRSEYRLRIRVRKGYHQCWKSPGMDFDNAMAGPYKQVRNPTKEQEAAGFEVGYENGDVKKILDGKGDVELIAVECPQELYEQHLEAMSVKSTRMYSDVKEGFFRATEEINRSMTDKKARITAVDNSGEVQA